MDTCDIIFLYLTVFLKFSKWKLKITLKSYAETFFCLAPLLDLNPYPSIKVVNKSMYCMWGLFVCQYEVSTEASIVFFSEWFLLVGNISPLYPPVPNLPSSLDSRRMCKPSPSHTHIQILQLFFFSLVFVSGLMLADILYWLRLNSIYHVQKYWVTWVGHP